MSGDASDLRVSRKIESPRGCVPGDPEKCPVDVTKRRAAVNLERKIFAECCGNTSQVCCGLKSQWEGVSTVETATVGNTLKKLGCWGHQAVATA